MSGAAKSSSYLETRHYFIKFESVWANLFLELSAEKECSMRTEYVSNIGFNSTKKWYNFASKHINPTFALLGALRTL